jgi:hypothetical protein
LNVTTGADPTVTVHGTGASVVSLPAGSVPVAVTLFCPGSNCTAEKVAMPPAKDEGMSVSVIPLFATNKRMLSFSALNVTSCVTVVDDCWTLPHRFAGVASVSTGAIGSTQSATAALVPTTLGLTASARLTWIAVAVFKLPFAFSRLSGSVTLVKRR